MTRVKQIIYTFLPILLVVLLSACSSTNRESTKEKPEASMPSVTAGTIQISTVAEDKQSTAVSESADPSNNADILMFSETDWNRDNQYWIQDYEPSVCLPHADVLPDTLGKVAGRTSDTTNSEKRYIAALDIEIPIPEGSYLYCVSGMYLNSDGSALRMDFVDEYILTIKEMTEEELVKAVYDYPDRDGMTRLAPYWVLWNFRVFYKDYYPLEQLASARIRTSGEIRIKGDYLIEMGVTRWGVTNDGSHIPLYCPEENPLDLSVKEEKWPLETVRQAVISGTKSADVYYLDLDEPLVNGDFGSHAEVLFDNTRSVTSLWPRFPDASPASDDWWNDYQTAIAELADNDKKYAYPNIQIVFSQESLSASVETRQMQLQYRDGWFQDEKQDRTIRAFAYAWLKAMGMETELQDIVVCLKESECGVPFYLVLRAEKGEAKQLLPVLRGIAYFSLCDMSFVRNYLTESWR